MLILRPIQNQQSAHRSSQLLVSSSHRKSTLTFLQLILRQFPQLIHIRRTPRHRPLHNLRPASQHRLRSNRIRRRLGRNLNDPNPRILRSTIMGSIFQIPQPRLQRRRIIFANHLAIDDNFGFAANGSPFAGGIEEGDVDFGVGFQVVGFAGFGVGVEEEVDAAALLVGRRRWKLVSCCTITIPMQNVLLFKGWNEFATVPWRLEPCISRPASRCFRSWWSSCRICRIR